MTKEQYEAITAPYRNDPVRAGRLAAYNILITLVVFIGYPLVLLLLLLRRDPMLLRSILIPLDGFLLVSVFRYLLNRPRPYEVFGIPPVIDKDTRGKSFPSRHVYSAAVIAATICMIPGMRLFGCFFLLLAAEIGRIRIRTGVHFPLDVVCGYGAGLLTAVIGYGIAYILR